MFLILSPLDLILYRSTTLLTRNKVILMTSRIYEEGKDCLSDYEIPSEVTTNFSPDLES